MKLKINEDLLAKQGKIKNGEIRATSKKDLMSGKARKNLVVNFCWQCGLKYYTRKSKQMLFCSGECSTEYFKQKRGLV